jgi:S-adenosylmethionine/arginine decarboxylase-like enzyme
MKAVTRPQAVYITADGNEGITGSINLATSHIAGHVWDTSELLMFDIYSCKPFDSDAVVAKLASYFDGFRDVHWLYVDREKFNVALYRADNLGNIPIEHTKE